MVHFDYANLTLEDAMISYAIRARSRAYIVDDWRFFKLDYPCVNTAQELYDKFWNEIIPNKHTYDIVQQYPGYGHLLSFIVNPLEIDPAPAPGPDGANNPPVSTNL